MSLSCNLCKTKLGKTGYKVRCNDCDRWFHKKYISISDLDFENLRKGVDHLLCESCCAEDVDEGDPTMILSKRPSKLTLEDLMNKLNKMEAKYNKLLDELDRAAAENKLLKTELGECKEEMAILDEKLDRNTDDIVAQIREREHRARNIIVHDLSESASASLEEKIQHDINVISKLVELANIRDIERVIRIEKRGAHARPIKVVFSNQGLVGNIWRNVSQILNNSRSKVSIQDDRTDQQRSAPTLVKCRMNWISGSRLV
ncbi:hypothetical protein HHI36_004519 [Cryptolaemus montrouzieri]|uniref:Uncharacterized protein n=1 Tax=Cryptolaemus montrouzieri TaxID=559131 RepID=A0ABD2NRF6_9CUCU